MPIVLGISAWYHDAAAALVVDGDIVAAAQEERFTRVKHTADFPGQAIRYCLQEAGICLSEVDAVVFYDKPLLKFERLLETYFSFAPKGLKSFVKSMPVWIEEKLFLKRNIRKGLNAIEPIKSPKYELLFSTHHQSHAASAFYPSPFEEATVLTIDGVGEWATATIAHGKGAQLNLLQEMKFPHSVGLLYSAVTQFLGFRVNSGEYKVMGLAPYGDANADQTRQFISSICTQLCDIKNDGSVWLNQDYFEYATGLQMVKPAKWKSLFGMPLRKETDPLTNAHCNLALAIQLVTEEVVQKMATHAISLTGSRNLCLAGGVALNCVANGKLERTDTCSSIWVQPAAGDAGGALGAALAVTYGYYELSRKIQHPDAMKGSFLGPEFANISESVTAENAVFEKIENDDTLNDIVAGLLADGNIVGWFQGRMEFGPRALGNRSILADAANENMQQKLNLSIKFREGFRPFAPAVLAEDASVLFDSEKASPYMTSVAFVKPEHRIEQKISRDSVALTDSIKSVRSSIPAVTHMDYSARLQTVHKETNPAFHALLSAFKKHTGRGILVNTSFNVRGEPIVCTDYDAWRCFMETDMDFLVIGHHLFHKKKQPDFDNREKWKRNWKPD